MNLRKCLSALAALSIVFSTQAAYAQHVVDGNPVIGNGVRPPGGDHHVQDWFAQYDNIRRQSQMNPVERQKADKLLSGGMAMLVPGPEKIATAQLLTKLVKNNQQAADQMKGLKLYPETQLLHRGYYQYFTDAAGLFTDYLTVQNNLFATDATGKTVAGQLMARKQGLELLDQKNKALDAQLRQQFGIPPYQY
jgi:hypothetical protein